MIELLAVIAIIAILATLLLPSLSKAKEQGEAIKCLGQGMADENARQSEKDGRVSNFN